MSRTIRLGAATFRVDDDKPTFWDRLEAGLWEPETLALLARWLGPGTTFVDLGAWVGPLTLYAAALGAAVVAVEADPAAARLLAANLGANRSLAPRVTVLERAVAPRTGIVRLGSRRKPGDSMSSVLLAGGPDGGAATWSVRTITPAEIAARVAGSRRLVVKLDLEGAEYAVLPAMQPLADLADLLVVALHPDILRETGGDDPDGRAREALSAYGDWCVLAADGSAGRGLRLSAALREVPVARSWVLANPRRRAEIPP